MNRGQVAGNITEPKFHPGEVPRLQFAIADRYWNRKKKEEETQWVECMIFGIRAEKLQPKLSKGDFLVAVGTFRVSKYQDKNEVWHKSCCLLVDDLELRYGNNKPKPSTGPPVHDPGVESLPNAPPGDTDDIPF